MGCGCGLCSTDEKKWKETTSVEIAKKKLEDFKIGQKVTIMITGTVKSLGDLYGGPCEDENTSRIGIEIDSRKVKGISSDEEVVDALMETDQEEETD